MTQGLRRLYGRDQLHFITCSCYGRLPESGTPERRDFLLEILEETRRKYQFVVYGYVVMPEHFHLLTTEPDIGDPSVVMKVIKERFSRQVNRERRSSHSLAKSADEWGTRRDAIKTVVWEKRFYDFNVWSARKEIEKIRYMHWTPVKRGLVERPEDWKWSSFRAYLYGEPGPVRVRFQEWPLKIECRPIQSSGRG